MPFAPSSFLLLVVRPGAPSSVLAPSSHSCDLLYVALVVTAGTFSPIGSCASAVWKVPWHCTQGFWVGQPIVAPLKMGQVTSCRHQRNPRTFLDVWGDHVHSFTCFVFRL